MPGVTSTPRSHMTAKGIRPGRATGMLCVVWRGPSRRPTPRTLARERRLVPSESVAMQVGASGCTRPPIFRTWLGNMMLPPSGYAESPDHRSIFEPVDLGRNRIRERPCWRGRRVSARWNPRRLDCKLAGREDGFRLGKWVTLEARTGSRKIHTTFMHAIYQSARLSAGQDEPPLVFPGGCEWRGNPVSTHPPTQQQGAHNPWLF